MRMGFARGQAPAIGTSRRGKVASMGVRLSGDGPVKRPILHEPCKTNKNKKNKAVAEEGH